MSIYNAIANAGQNAGAPITNYFANKYQVDRDKMLDQEAQKQNAFVMQRENFKLQQDALAQAAQVYAAKGPDESFALLDYVSDQNNLPRPDRAQLDPILRGMAATYQGQGSMPSGVVEFNALTEGLSPEDAEQARRIKLGLAPKAGNATPASASPIGTPIRDQNGNVVVVVQKPDGSIGYERTGVVGQKDTPTYVGEAILEASDEYGKASGQAARAQSMAQNFRANADKMPRGLPGQIDAFVRKALGTEDELNLLRTDFIGFKNELMTGSLPPGVASDRDIALIQAGFPNDFSNPDLVAEFLDARARILAGKARFAAFKATYLSQNQSPIGLFEAWQAQNGGGPQGSGAAPPQEVERTVYDDSGWQR
jgi:hypothetical protein